jgi:predicted transcriptional regulator
MPTHSSVGALEEMSQRFVNAWHRLELLRAVHENPAPSVKALAERLGRDYKRVHLDVETLTASGLLHRENGNVSAPYVAITAEMRL